MNDRPHDPLDPDAIGLAVDAAELHEIDAGDAVPPGLADVIRRAAAAMPDLGTREEAELAEALDAMPDAGESGTFGGLADFIEAARGNADALAEARAQQPLPAMPPMASRRRAWPIAMLFAAAAVLVLVPMLWSQLAGTRIDAAPPTDTSGEAALQSLEEDEARTPFVDREPPRRAPPKPEPESEPESEPEPESESEPEIRAPARKPPRPDRLHTLDAEARAAWTLGDLGLAEDKFRQLVRIGKRGRAVDLAYGDLFSIARQRSDEPGLRRYWKQYAAKFPRGRFIDDARAGLCRTAPRSEARSCWRAYLADRPHGTYRRDAEAAIAKP
jgi:hypothetical protein